MHAALVEDAGGTSYILSNNHVLALVNEGSIGDDVVQPGILDACPDVNPIDAVADLSDFVSISWAGINVVDATIAETRAGQVDTSGLTHDIGTVGANTLMAYPGIARG